MFKKLLKIVTAPIVYPAKAIKAIAKPIVTVVKVGQGISSVAIAYKQAEQESQMTGKSVFLSKTVWLNVLTLAAQYIGVLPLTPEMSLIALAVINIGLRLVSSGPITTFNWLLGILSSKA